MYINTRAHIYVQHITMKKHSVLHLDYIYFKHHQSMQIKQLNNLVLHPKIKGYFVLL